MWHLSAIGVGSYLTLVFINYKASMDKPFKNLRFYYLHLIALYEQRCVIMSCGSAVVGCLKGEGVGGVIRHCVNVRQNGNRYADML